MRPYNSIPQKWKPHSRTKMANCRLVERAAWVILATMPITVTLELRFKPDAVAAGRDLMRQTLKATRAFDGNLGTDVLVDQDDEAHWLIYELWETVEADEAYRAFRAGEGKVTELPPLLAAPPVKIRYTTSDI
jgi:quinol monooxygenase YgiN